MAIDSDLERQRGYLIDPPGGRGTVRPCRGDRVVIGCWALACPALRARLLESTGHAGRASCRGLSGRDTGVREKAAKEHLFHLFPMAGGYMQQAAARSPVCSVRGLEHRPISEGRRRFHTASRLRAHLLWARQSKRKPNGRTSPPRSSPPTVGVTSAGQ